MTQAKAEQVLSGCMAEREVSKTASILCVCRKQVEEQQRQELLHRSHGAVDYAAQRNADSQSMSYIDNSKRVLEEAFQTGTAVLGNMSGQRERLKVCHSDQPNCLHVEPATGCDMVCCAEGC